MLIKGEEVVLSIVNVAFEGKSISRLDDLVVFIEGGVPGDTIKARLTKIKRNYAEAKLLEVITPSSLRVSPRCNYFGTCGGCKWQNVDYQEQLRFKQQHVVDAFERIGGFKDLNILPIIGSDNIYFYRSKMEYSFSDQQWLWSGLPTAVVDNPSQIYLGLHVPQRYDKVLDIEKCHLQSEISNHILNFTREYSRTNGLSVYDSKTEAGFLRFLVIRESKRTGEVMVNLVTFDDKPNLLEQYAQKLHREIPGVTTIINTINSKKAQIAFGDVEKVYLGDGYIHEQLEQFRFVVSANSFFQTNTLQAEKLYRIAKEYGEFNSDDIVYDLYSGTGSIGIYISDSVERVIGIESVESAIQDAERNVRENGITNCSFVLGDLKDRLTKDTEWMSSHPKPVAIVIDPPRSGMHPKVIEEILSLAPDRIVYVSCNPTTQARDVQALCANQYQLIKMQPVDMFPHTYHIENVALLLKK